MSISGHEWFAPGQTTRAWKGETQRTGTITGETGVPATFDLVMRTESGWFSRACPTALLVVSEARLKPNDLTQAGISYLPQYRA